MCNKLFDCHHFDKDLYMSVKKGCKLVKQKHLLVIERRVARLKNLGNKTLSEYFDTVVQLVPNIMSLKPGMLTLFRHK